MKERYTQPSEATVTSSPGDLAAPSPKTTAAQSFFNTELRPQPTMKVSLDPATFLLLTALYQEIKVQNDIALAKMKQEQKDKQEALDAAKLEKMEDDRRFAEVRHSLYL